MKIVFDLQSLQGNNRNRGIGRYSLALTQAILRQDHHHDIYLCLNSNSIETIENIRLSFNTLIPENNIKIFDIPKLHKNTDESKISEIIRENFIADLNPDLIYISSIFEKNKLDTPISIGEFNHSSLNAVTLYDLIPYIYSKFYLEDIKFRDFFFRKMQFLKKSNLILTISDSSATEAENILGIKKKYIHNCSVGIDPKFKKININPEDKKKIKKKYGINKKFIFYVGGLDFRKNIQGLLAAYILLPAAIRKNFQLLIIISDVTHSVNQYLQEFRQRYYLDSEELILLMHVEENELVMLYNLCSLFVFPSLHEGFGLPILEAMACGAPTISSNTSSMPEAVGCEIALFNPKKAQSIANKIQEVLTNKNIQDFLKEHGTQQVKKFTWENVAKKALTAFEELYKNKIPKKSICYKNFVKKKMAFVSPLPPLQTGIADYSAQLLPNLAIFYEITLITNQKKIDDFWLNANFTIQSDEWFVKNSNKFEVIVYQFGNSHYHFFMLQLLYLFPGIVVLHDFFLSGLHQWIDIIAEKGQYLFYQSIYYSHGFPALLELVKTDRRSIIEKYPCNLKVLKRALGIIVLSKHTIDLAEYWYGPNITSKFFLIYPPHLPKKISPLERNEIRKKLKFNKNDFLICSFGFLGDTKQCHRTILACSDPKLSAVNFHLIFIGGNADLEYNQLLYNIINKNNLQKKIKFIGFASPETYVDYLISADIAIQLRTKSRGETSACILNCLSYGIPTIVNNHGSIQELSESVVIKLNDKFTDNELSEAIIKLYTDRFLRSNLSNNALKYIEKKHHPVDIAKNYYHSIENFYCFHNSNYREKYLTQKISTYGLNQLDKKSLLAISETISANRLSITYPKLLIDISNIEINNTSFLLIELIKNLLSVFIKKIRVELVYYNNIINRYCYATDLATTFLNLENKLYANIPIDIFSQDILLITSSIVETPINNYIKLLISKGIKTFYFILNEYLHNQFEVSENITFQFNLNNTISLPKGFICLENTAFDLFTSYLNKYYFDINTEIKISKIISTDAIFFTNKLNELIMQDNWDIKLKLKKNHIKNSIFLKDSSHELV